jgi:glycosyltransferase involved in cell wall biosynthesis
MVDAAKRGIPTYDRKVQGQPIRVAHVAQLDQNAVSRVDRSVSGVDRMVSGLLAHLGAHGVVGEIWNLRQAQDAIAESILGSVRNVTLPAYGKSRSALFGLPDSTRRFLDERRTEIDLLHLHSVFIPDNVWIAKRVGLPYVITPHGGYSPEVLRGRNRFLKTAWIRMHERTYVEGARLVHAVSSREREQLREIFDIKALMFAPNAIELTAGMVAPSERLHLSPSTIKASMCFSRVMHAT